jgi:hypothetical protein
MDRTGNHHVLSEISQSEKDKHHMFSDIWNLVLKKKKRITVWRLLFVGENQWEREGKRKM